MLHCRPHPILIYPRSLTIGTVTLPDGFHTDPADRIIVATARKFAAPIITADEKIRAYRHVRTIW